MQVEVKPYIREDGVRVEGYVRNLPGNGQASGYVQSSGGKKFQAAGRYRKEGLDLGFIRKQSGEMSFQGQASPMPNTNVSSTVTRDTKGRVRGEAKIASGLGEFNISRSANGQMALEASRTGLPYNTGVQATVQGTLKAFQATGSLVSDLGEIDLSRDKAGKINYDIRPNMGGIATAIGEFMRNQAQKAAEAPGAVADAATQAAQSVRTAADVVVDADVSPGVANAVIGATAIGAASAGGLAAPVLLAGAATPAAMSAAATGTALSTTPVAGLLPAAGATVARGGAIALTAAPPVGATTVARAAVPQVVKKAAQTVVPMVGSRGKFKVVDATGKSLMNGLNKQQAAKMAAQFGQIL